MKNKPERHKESNVFRFKAFSDRVTEIDLRKTALYHIKHKNEDNSDVDACEFHQAYCKWTVLNLTEEYNGYQKKIRNIVTLPQLLHQKNFVIETLGEAIDKATILSLQPLLEHIVALARDLREDFYPYFEQFLTRLIKLLHTKDSELLEWALITLAYLFKILKPFLKKNLPIVFKAVFPLLNERNPEHITNFAAECFSFVVRDIKDKEKFLSLILNAVHKHQNGIIGCSRLLADIICGISGQFHSCAEQFLQIYFMALTKPDTFDVEILQNILSETITTIIQHVTSANFSIFWNIIYKCIEETLNETNQTKSDGIEKMLTLIGIAIEARNGKYLIDSNQLINVLLKVINDKNLNENCLNCTWNLVAVVLLAKNVIVTQLDASRLCEKSTHITSSAIFESFIWNCVKFSQFDILILPKFLSYFDKNTTTRSALELLAKIVQAKSPLCANGEHLSTKKLYPMRMKSIKGIEAIEKQILSAKLTDEWLTENIEQFSSAIIIFPHIIGADITKVKQKIVKLIDGFADQLNDENEMRFSNKNKRILFILTILIETNLYLETSSNKLKKSDKIPLKNIIAKLLSFASGENFNSVAALRSLDLLFTYEHQNDTKNLEFNFQLFTNVHDHIANNLSSRYHEIRLLTAHILDQFSDLIEWTERLNSIYSIFYQIESIEPTTITYREQLLKFQKIEGDAKSLAALKKIHNKIHLDILKFAFGYLYVNFKLLWKPLIELIESHFDAIELEEFWEVFKWKLDETTQCLRENTSSDGDNNDIVECFGESDSWVVEKFQFFWANNERSADLINYRVQLWQMIPSLGTLREVKNREIVGIFIDFIENEYRRSLGEDTYTYWNIQKKSIEDEDDGEANTEPTADDVEVDDEKSTVSPGTQRTLCAILQSFSGQQNPKALYREPDLRAFYYELLSHRNSTVQKLALDCIVAYKHKYLQPYKDEIYNLIDDSKFKPAIQILTFGKETNIIQDEHRIDLMPILLRILFPKMFQRIPGAQKGANQARKALIIRFLGSCHEDEVMDMFSMSFKVFEGMIQDDAMIMCKTIIDTIDLQHILSPKKLQSALNIIDIIQNEISGLMSGKFLRHILNLLLIIESTVIGILQKEITSKMSATFKALRGNCVHMLQRFFEHFESYEWNNNEIDAIFYVFVAPVAAGLPIDGVQTVSPILKLFNTFTKYPRLFILLTRRTSFIDKTSDTTPIKLMMDLLINPKVRPIVGVSIMQSIENLLTINEDETKSTISIENCQMIDKKLLSALDNHATLNFGSKILLSYLPEILQRLKMNLKQRRGLTKRELLILSKVTGLISDSSTCNVLLTILLPILVRKSHRNADDETLMRMVHTIINLFAKIERPEKHLRNIAPMFMQITAVGPRKCLCELLKTISNRCTDNEKKKDELKLIAEVINKLNAWNRRFVEQPDYEERLMAYKQITELTNAGRIGLDLGILIIYQSFHFLKFDRDMALRDSAAYHLRSMIPMLIKKLQIDNQNDVDYLIGTVILNLIRNSLRNENNSVRNDAIQLLGEMVRECSDAHPVLTDLYPLTCKMDREIDFFDNITHLQIIRHGRALLRFCAIAKTYEKPPNPRTLTQFILPLASNYILTQKHTAHHNIVTAAIDTLGAVCHLLPWYQYESILKYYLKALRYNVEYQQQIVRIVRQILDSFHFDLSKANLQPSKLPKPEFDENSALDVSHDEKVTKCDAKDEDEGEETVITDDVKDDTKLDDELDALNSNNDNDTMSDFEPPTKKQKKFAYDVSIVLPSSLAKKIVQHIAKKLIPTLNHSITALSTFETFHKVNKIKRRSERAEEEILRVPIALAMVKLLQKMPNGMLEQSITGILIKVCMFLRSPLISVRRTTRIILRDIMNVVGSEHLETLLSHMQTMLTKGYQVHVLTITVHFILNEMKTILKNGIIDKSLQCILDVCLRDIFGQTGEEKQITKIGKHTPEAKPHNKSFLTLEICAANISESCLLDLIIPFKDQLAASQSKKIVLRVQECFQKIIAGLTTNKQLSIESMMVFIHGVASESIPDLLPKEPKNRINNDDKMNKKNRLREDCYIIPMDPAADGRSGAVKKMVVTNTRANAHVLIEFGLQLLQTILQRGKLLKINYQQFIEPFISILYDSLKSMHIRVTTFSLQSLSTMIHKEIESKQLHNLITKIVEQIFIIFHQYVAANTDMSNENFELVQSAFKMIVNLLNCSKQYDIELEQLKQLLFYAEQYLNVGDAKKQKISFSILKSIIGRKLKIPQLNEIMLQVARLAIQSESDSTRQKSKGVIVNYLMEYPLGKKVDQFVELLIANLNYELQSGREAAISILHSIVKRFPVKYLDRQCGLLFISGGTRLINDDATECRRQIAEFLETLLSRIDVNRRDELFVTVLHILSDDKPSHREMGALLCTRFVNVEKQKFEKRFSKVLPKLIAAMTMSRSSVASNAVAGKFVRAAIIKKAEAEYNENGEVIDDDDDDGEEDEDEENEKQRAIDHQLIQIQNTIQNIFEHFIEYLLDKHSDYIDEIAYESQKLLANEHVWVRLNALKTLQTILTNIDAEIINNKLNGMDSKKSTPLQYLYSNPEQEIKALTLDLCAQLLPGETEEEIADIVTINLLFIANMLKEIPFGNIKNDENDNDDDDEQQNVKRTINLAWLFRRMRYVVHAEVAKAAQNIILRSAVFKWIESLIELMPSIALDKLAFSILSPLVREMSDEEQHTNVRLKNLAIKVGDAVRAKIGDDEYNLLRAKIQQKLMIRRAERKKVIAMEKVNDPVRAAKRQQGMRDRKKVAKRRTREAFKTTGAPMKKRKRIQNDLY